MGARGQGSGLRDQGSGVRGQGSGFGASRGRYDPTSRGSGEVNIEKLSRFRSLAESRGFSRDVLSNDEEVSEKRDLWTFKSVTTCRHIGAVKYRRGSSATTHSKEFLQHLSAETPGPDLSLNGHEM